MYHHNAQWAVSSSTIWLNFRTVCDFFWDALQHGLVEKCTLFF
jgi:hypothetical protein